MDLNPLITALRTIIVGVWPEVATTGVFEAEHADTIPWSDLPLPYALILIEGAPRSAASPLDEVWVEPEVQIFYVAQTTGASSGIRTKLEALADVLWPAAPGADPLVTADVAQVLDEPGISWAADIAPNVGFQEAGEQRRAGRLSVKVLL